MLRSLAPNIVLYDDTNPKIRRTQTEDFTEVHSLNLR